MVDERRHASPRGGLGPRHVAFIALLIVVAALAGYRVGAGRGAGSSLSDSGVAVDTPVIAPQAKATSAEDARQDALRQGCAPCALPGNAPPPTEIAAAATTSTGASVAGGVPSAGTASVAPANSVVGPLTGAEGSSTGTTGSGTATVGAAVAAEVPRRCGTPADEFDSAAFEQWQAMWSARKPLPKWMPSLWFPCERTVAQREKQAMLRYDQTSSCVEAVGQPSTANAVVMLSSCSYVSRARDLLHALRKKGAYHGDVVIVYDGPAEELFKGLQDLSASEKERVIAVRASSLLPRGEYSNPPPYPCYSDVGKKHAKMFGTKKKRMLAWRAYYLKFTLFSPFFKQWGRILYLDTGCTIHRPSIDAFFSKIDSTGLVMANPDAWPADTDTHKLDSQFFKDCDAKMYKRLQSEEDLAQPFFQSTVMLYDTSVITSSTISDLAALSYKYAPITSSDQPIMSLYFHNHKHQYRPLPYRLPFTDEIPYDFAERLEGGRYIVTAWHYGAYRPKAPKNKKNKKRKLRA